MTFVYLIVLTGLFLNFYTSSYRGTAKRQKTEPQPPSRPAGGSSVVQKGPRHLPHAWSILKSSGFGCFPRND